MSRRIPAAILREVRTRAKETCEYCKLPQQWQEAQFHVDHVFPRSAGGRTSIENLALACVSCSLRKAARLRALDSQSEMLVPLFDPRRDLWEDHFQFLSNWTVAGKTPIGRATIEALLLNRPTIIAIRRKLAKQGMFP